MNRIAWIEGIKGISAVIVLLNHLSTLIEFPSNSVMTFFTNGKMAVHIFIALSSFGCYASIKQQPIPNFQKIIIKRYFRLAFPITFTLLILAIMQVLGLLWNIDYYDVSKDPWFLNDTHNYHALIYALFMGPFGLDFGWLNVLWMMGYIFIAPFLSILYHIASKRMVKERKLFLLVGCIFLSRYYDYWLLGLFWGLVLYELLSLFVAIKTVLKHIIGISLLVILFILSFKISNYLVDNKTWSELSFIEASVLLLLLALYQKIQKILTCKIVLFIGKISMGIYLFHVPIIESLGCWLKLHNVNDVLVFLSLIIITIVLANYYTKYIEPRCNQISFSIVNYLIKEPK